MLEVQRKEGVAAAEPAEIKVKEFGTMKPSKYSSRGWGCDNQCEDCERYRRHTAGNRGHPSTGYG